MAAPAKKRAVNFGENDSSKNDREDSDDSDEYSVEEEVEGTSEKEVIQVEFEGRNPIDSDFHGIKQLLNQLFLKAHLNLSELTELIIGQNYVGSVIKQSTTEEEDSDDDETDVNDVFGITTVINLTEKQKLECVQQLRSLLLELAVEHGSDSVVDFVRNLLSNDSKPVGLLISERFINIPPAIVVPLLKSLSNEMKRAVEKKMAFDFSYLILICKLFKCESSKKSNKKKQSNEPEILWSNPEEELIDEEAEAKFEFSVKNDADSGLSGGWGVNDSEMTPLRRVLIIPARKLDDLILKVEEGLK